MPTPKRPPAFQFYPNAWFGSVAVETMPADVEGTFIRLLARQWLAVTLPADPEQLRKLTKLSARRWPSAWVYLEPRFPLVDGGRRNETLHDLHIEREQFIAKQALNGGKGGRPEKPKPNPSLTQALSGGKGLGNPNESSVSVSGSGTATATTFPKPKVGSNSQLPDTDEAFAIAGPVVARHAHDALRKLLAAQPDPETWARIIVAYASGQSADGGRPTDAGRLAAAVQDYVAQGKHVNGNTGLFRGFVKRAKTPDRGRYNEQTEDERNAEILHDIRAFNERQRMMGDMGLPLKPVPTWANRIDAAFPDGRTNPRQVAA